MAELPRNKLLPACGYVSGELPKSPGSANAAFITRTDVELEPWPSRSLGLTGAFVPSF
jgi:hypothetical protein